MTIVGVCGRGFAEKSGTRFNWLIFRNGLGEAYEPGGKTVVNSPVSIRLLEFKGFVSRSF